MLKEAYGDRANPEPRRSVYRYIPILRPRATPPIRAGQATETHSEKYGSFDW